ncbi:hypothetical protein O9992_27730 [Vibrio lentus]|nr:hypothetical protein [Vibrio lentus]
MVKRTSLDKLIQGQDELSLFAQQVERLTIEREHARKLTLAVETQRTKIRQASKNVTA